MSAKRRHSPPGPCPLLIYHELDDVAQRADVHLPGGHRKPWRPFSRRVNRDDSTKHDAAAARVLDGAAPELMRRPRQENGNSTIVVER